MDSTLIWPALPGTSFTVEGRDPSERDPDRVFEDRTFNQAIATAGSYASQDPARIYAIYLIDETKGLFDKDRKKRLLTADTGALPFAVAA